MTRKQRPLKENKKLKKIVVTVLPKSSFISSSSIRLTLKLLKPLGHSPEVMSFCISPEHYLSNGAQISRARYTS
jgi:hypothetical protein